MPFERPTLPQLIERQVADFESRLPDADVRSPGSNLAVMAKIGAATAHGLYGFQAWIADQIHPDTAAAETLARIATIWGVNRIAATFAGGDLTMTGTNGAIIPAATRLQRGDGVEYTVAEEATIADGTATVAVDAALAGVAGNADAGAKVNLVSPIAGVQSAAVVAAGALTGGADAETDAALLARLLDRIRQPPHGGASFDYVKWTFAADARITRVWVYPLELGAGTVTIRFMMDDTYADGIPLAGDVAAVQAYIDAVRPVTADVTVVAPTAVAMDPNIGGLSPVSQAVKDAIEAELKDLLSREAEPGGTILLSHVREAISIAAGEHDHALVSPAADVEHETGEIAVLGTVTWS